MLTSCKFGRFYYVFIGYQLVLLDYIGSTGFYGI